MIVRALVVPKLPKIGCCCYQQLTTIRRDPPNLGMALCCAPHPALFLDRFGRRGSQLLIEDRGHNQSRSLWLLLWDYQKGASLFRPAAELCSARTLRLHSGQAPRAPVPTQAHAHRYITCFSTNSQNPGADLFRLATTNARFWEIPAA